MDLMSYRTGTNLVLMCRVGDDVNDCSIRLDWC